MHAKSAVERLKTAKTRGKLTAVKLDPLVAVRALEWATGLQVSIHSADPRLLAAVPPERRNRHAHPLCQAAKAVRIASCRAHCTAHCHRLATANSGRAAATVCHAGMGELSVAVIVHGSVVGVLFAGGWRPAGAEAAASHLPAARRLPTHDALTLALLSELVEQTAMRLGRGLESAALVRRGDDLRQRIDDWLASNHADGDLAGLAVHLGLSPDRTRHRVRELLGTSFRAARAAWRQRTVERSAVAGLSIGEASRRAGWRDASSWRAWRRQASCVPAGGDV